MIDLYSRKVAGWSMGKNNDTALVIDALSMAIKTSQDTASIAAFRSRFYLQGL
ncbi:MAG: hypothetical protein H0A76_04265 [Candidatus Thiodubiliella endoseptemdiera]|uniref:Uncharacterized protein n=1 Tax=Candidatus Thiodubiliella endoseptemdiera TaxID=2738886 RepID=A0A853F019_9GAMM|nr:hypothetical protein [Candidatus Thiodubiliella endoseptemdiera]